MNILFFEDDISGHRMEYLHHLHVGALTDKNNVYFFYVPESFEKKKKLFSWPSAENIVFRYLTDDEVRKSNAGNLLVSGLKKSLLLRKKTKEVSADRVFLSTFSVFLPFICFLLSSQTKAIGILYDVHTLKGEACSRIRHHIEKFRFWITVKSRCVEKLFVLNDTQSASVLNRMIHTDKFQGIVDPVPTINNLKLTDMRTNLDIPLGNTIYLHFGGMSVRKGSLDILKAICQAGNTEFRNKTFIFAGKIYDDIKTEFYKLLDEAKNKAQVIVFDEFCRYELLYDLCYTSDIILIPYKLTTFSSGVLGYASLFDKMVIGPSEGLIGYLIKTYQIGITAEDLDYKGLYRLLCGDLPSVHSTKYAESNKVENFISTIFNVIN